MLLPHCVSWTPKEIHALLLLGFGPSKIEAGAKN